MIKIPAHIKKCIEALEEKGFSAYAVGGAVRDSLLCRKVNDWDVCTNALPDEVSAIFSSRCHVIPTGIAHGTVTVVLDSERGEREPVEITTFRIDGEYLDHRRPRDVAFADRLDEDLSRRDFTVNAMAYNEREGLVDLFSGKEDIKNRLVRCVGDPNVRFEEDALRILRAFRFSAQLGFTIEEKTLLAAGNKAPLLEKIARERIGAELCKLIASSGVRYALEKMLEANIFSALFPNLPAPDKKALDIVGALKDGNAMLRLAALICEYSEENKAKFLSSLRLSNDQRKRVTRLCAAARFLPDKEKSISVNARIFLSLYENICDDAIEIFSAFAAVGQSCASELINAVISEKSKRRCLSLSDLAVKGNDILPLCKNDHARVGKILNALLEQVIEDPDKNEKSVLMPIAKDLISIDDF